MARKKKKDNAKTFIFFEVVGIVIIALAILTMTLEDSLVARIFTFVNRVFMGNLNFIIPLIFIYIGLYAMIKRSWPIGWTRRRTGVLLMICTFLLYFHVSFFADRYPDGNYSSADIISESFSSVISSGNLESDLGGGLIGAFLYAISYLLFANVGSYLLMFALLLVSIILVFNVSYVDFGRWVQSIFIRSQNAKPKKENVVTQSSKQQNIEVEEDLEPIETEKPVKVNILTKADNTWVKKLFQKKATDNDSSTMADREFETTVADVSVDSANETVIIRDFTEQTTTPAVPDDTEFESLEPDVVFPVKQLELPLYTLPNFNLLTKPNVQGKLPEQNDMMGNARKLEKTLESFGVRAKVLEVHRGPAVTRYELQPDVGVKVSRIVSLTDDIALALAAKDIRMEAPIPGKSAIGIEVPNSEVAIVTMREVMESSAFHESNAKLTIAFGRDISGQPIVGNLAKMPHLLVAGATGSGKSVCINGIIVSILYKAKPDEVKFLMVDPKMVELNMYNGIPHLLAPVVTDPRRASLALKKVVVEMEKRYELFSKTGTRNIEGYNALVIDHSVEQPFVTPLPYIVVIVDELADLMMVAANDVEDAICRLAQMARAAGIHLIIATQRPSVDVITGVIKANIPSRIAFGVSSQIDSRTILDTGGAEKLLGRGDMLYLPVGANKPMRVQGAFLSDKEVESVVEFCKNQEKAVYQEDLVPEIEEQTSNTTDFEDDLFEQAVMIVLEGKQASVSYLQRRLRIGYTRAARLIDMMEAKSIVGPYEGSKPREVLMTAEQFTQLRTK